MQKLIAIDGNSLMHRAYWALPSMTAKSGVPTGAVFGFVNMLLRLLSYEPDYLVAAFDMHGPTFRHETYEDYKAGRKETPDDLRAQFPLVKELLRKMGVAVCEVERYEADDIIGTFARLANEKGIEALLVTGDRDALQLIGEKTHVLMTKKGVTETVEYDEAILFEQYGLRPGQMVDLKGLMGDSSDHLPGIPGVGEKTALKLLQKYGTLEETLARAEEETGALKTKLMENAELGRMSYRLGTIHTDAPVPFSLEGCAFIPSRMAEATPMMNELELRSLIARLPKGAASPAPAAKARETATHKVSDANALKALCEALGNTKKAALHAEGALLIALNEAEQYEVTLSATLFEAGLDEAEVLLALKPMLENEKIEKLFFDSKRFLHLAARHGVEIKGRRFDAMLADYLLHAIHPADSFKTLCAERLGQDTAGACALFALEKEMLVEMREKELTSLYDGVELPLAEVLFDMERTGFRVDLNAVKELGDAFAARAKTLEEQIYAHAGVSFNILSPKQLGTVLFDTLGLPAQKKNKSGYSTDAETLEALEDRHPIVKLITEYRFLSKLKSTFIDGLLNLTDKATGRVHTSFNQNVAATGRISSTEPNLQNIPVRTEVGREIRKAFIASEGNVLVGADYSQIELRLLAHMSGDERMIGAFLDGADFHARTASEVFGVPFERVSAAQRSAAKAVNFGIVYGISDFGLAKNLGVTRKQAGDYIKMYLDRYSGVRDYLRGAVEEGKRLGYVKTLMGRRRELPELNSSNYNTRSFGERVAMNMPLQGTAADIIKLAMVRVYAALKKEGLKAKLILQIHDELIIDAPIDEAPRAGEILCDCMQNAMRLKVPLSADVRTGHSWFDTK
ncbi:MAG: DNA polymerase I [Clostridiaceae bacterium]|nr:DNA polymerase I [Eubacteriales bacterium]